MNESGSFPIKKFSPAKQQLMDRLLDENANGSISEANRATLEALVAEAEELIVNNAKRLSELRKSGGLP